MLYKYHALRNLVPFILFKKRENTHEGVLLLVTLQVETCNHIKSNTLSCMFSSFSNCTNGTKSHKESQILNIVRLYPREL